MGKWIHRLTNIDKERQTANCASCGDVKLKRYNADRFCCINAVKKYYRRGDNEYFKEDPLPAGQRCEICGDNYKICYDHSHQDGKFRGWLCSDCNKMLGFAKDNVETLEKAKEYLLR